MENLSFREIREKNASRGVPSRTVRCTTRWTEAPQVRRQSFSTPEAVFASEKTRFCGERQLQRRRRTQLCAWGLVEGSAVIGILGILVTLNIVSRISDSARGTRLWSREQRGLFVRRRPPQRERCTKCGGFGIVRCSLCRGSGFVLYEKKLQHSDPCPLCTARRYIRCGMCHGSGRRKLVRRHDPALSSIRLSDPTSLYNAFRAWREEFVRRGSLSVGFLNHEGLLNRAFRVASAFADSLKSGIGRSWCTVQERVRAGIEQHLEARKKARMSRIARARSFLEERLQKESQ
jgi:hypothetical protein